MHALVIPSRADGEGPHNGTLLQLVFKLMRSINFHCHPERSEGPPHDRRVAPLPNLPLWIKRSHQIILLFSTPTFDLFLARDCVASAAKAFIVNESIDFVSLCKTS